MRDRAENGLWSGLTEGFRARVWAAQLPATASRPFLCVAGGARAQPLQAEAAEGLWAGALNVHPCAFSSALCKRAHHPVSMATGIPQRGERGGTLRKDSGKGTARVRAEGNTQEGVTWFCCRLAESISGAPRLLCVCPLLVPRRWQGGDATWPSPANTLALRHTA